MSALRTEADVVRALAGRAVTLDELYAACEAAGVTDRDNGHAPSTPGSRDTVWRRRVRNALQAQKAAGRAERIGKGVWVIEGTRDVPRRSILILLDGEPGPIELSFEHAWDFLRAQDEPCDLITGDPPYGLYTGVKKVDRNLGYQRDHSKVVPGYVEVEGEYLEFTHRWMSAAAEVLHPTAYLAVWTGTSMAWQIGAVAADLNMEMVTQIAVRRAFPLYTRARPSFAHWVVNVFTPTAKRGRFFQAQPEDGGYPQDLWVADKPPSAARPNKMRYKNALPVQQVDRLIRTFTPGPESGHDPWTAKVIDPFLGSGTTAVACLRRQRRFAGCDANRHALRFTMARISAEEHAHHEQTGDGAALRQLTMDM